MTKVNPFIIPVGSKYANSGNVYLTNKQHKAFRLNKKSFTSLDVINADNHQLICSIAPELYDKLEFFYDSDCGAYICTYQGLNENPSEVSTKNEHFDNCQFKKQNKVYTVPAKRASIKDPIYSFTYRINDLKKAGLNINPNSGDIFSVHYENGACIVMTASRNGTTLYSKKLSSNYGLDIPDALGIIKKHKIVKLVQVKNA